MQNVRMVFAKEGLAVFISHLDLLRCVSRALARACIPVKYTQGFNPQPYLIFSPPLSLGYAGYAELCDFSLEDDAMTMEELLEKLRAVMPQGVRPISCAPPVHKLGEIAAADYETELLLEGACAAQWEEPVRLCLSRESIPIVKRTKRGQREADLAKAMKKLQISSEKENTITLKCRLPLSGEDSLNPLYLLQVLRQELPAMPLADETISRLGFFLQDGSPFC